MFSRYVLSFVFLFSSSLFAQKIQKGFLLTSSHPHIEVLANKYMDYVVKDGRIRIMLPKKMYSINSIPKELLKHLQVINEGEYKSYIPVLKKMTEPDPQILSLVEKISEQEIVSIVASLSAFRSRKAGSEGNRQATDWIEGQFKEMGLETYKHCFQKDVCNVIALKKGESSSDYILVEGHLDSVGHANAGADDNASGAAGVLVLAKHLKDLKLDRSVIFFATNGEENGLLGAKAYVRKLSDEGTLSKIKFVINMDMIGYNQNNLVDIETNSEYENLATWMSEVVRQYTSLTPNITIPAWGSDHVPFLQRSIPTILTIEHWKTKTPCYHSSCDKPDHLNYKYAQQILRLNLASLILKSSNESL